MTHKSEDYKIYAVKYYINNNNPALQAQMKFVKILIVQGNHYIDGLKDIETLKRQNQI